MVFELEFQLECPRTSFETSFPKTGFENGMFAEKMKEKRIFYCTSFDLFSRTCKIITDKYKAHRYIRHTRTLNKSFYTLRVRVRVRVKVNRVRVS